MDEYPAVRIENLGFAHETQVTLLVVGDGQIPCAGILEHLHHFLHRHAVVQHRRRRGHQLPDGEKYHGIRFEGLEQLSKSGVQLNHEDYQLVYEGEIPDFKGNEILENKLKRELEIAPIICMNHSKLQKLEAKDIVDSIRNYNANKSMMDETFDIEVFNSCTFIKFWTLTNNSFLFMGVKI